MLKKYLINTAHQKVLDWFITHPEQSFYGAELAKKISLSTGGINKILKEFERAGVLVKNRRGKTDLYSLYEQSNQAIIKQLKTLSTLLLLEPLVEKLKIITHKIILYGSSSRGDNDQQSDIDILIVTTKTDKEVVEQLIAEFKNKNHITSKLQTSIKTSLEWSNLEIKDPVYFQEILRGLIIWDRLKTYE